MLVHNMDLGPVIMYTKGDLCNFFVVLRISVFRVDV